MQHIISNNDMINSREGSPTFDWITRKFLKKIFKVLRPKDAIVITGSCIVAYTLEKQCLASFLPGDIDVFVKENLKLEDEIFDRSFLISDILFPLQAEGIYSQPRHIPIKDGLHPRFKKYGNCKIDIVHIIEFSLFQKDPAVNQFGLFREDPAVNHPKLQIIIVADDSPTPTPEDLSLFYLTPFERKIVTSFDIDIVQGAYNPNSSGIIFAYSDTKDNIQKMEFWYICDPMRPFKLASVIERIQKYTDRGFTFVGFRDIIHSDLAILLPKFEIMMPEPFEHDVDDLLLDF
jgi:hypothetical protein